MTIKKSYAEIISFLEANATKKVSAILADKDFLLLVSQTRQAKTFLTDEHGEVIAIYCYYHKQWELLSEVDYGKKASSTTGYNTMCKVGVSKWTKQNNAVKQVGEQVLEMLEQGKIQASEIQSTKDALLANAKIIDTDDMPIGYATIDDLPV